MQKTLWDDFVNLPPDAQEQVRDFITFLQSRYSQKPSRKSLRRPKLTKEKFIGIWRDRKDLQDSSLWVRNTRKREWVKGLA
jgi:hypothetical protein